MDLTPLSIFCGFVPKMNALMLLALDVGIDSVTEILIHQVILWATTNVRHAGKNEQQMVRISG